MTLSTTCTVPAGGIAASAGTGKQYRVTVGGTWSFSGTERIALTATSERTGYVTVMGAGLVTGLVPSFAFTYKKKLYFLSGTTLYFSAIDRPTVFNDTNAAGNGFEELTNSSGTAETLKAIAPYQGKQVIFSRTTTQIWAVDADPNNNSLTQTLENVGTVASLSVKPIGELDVYLLSDSGFHSVRPRDASSNANVVGVGAPIDTLMQGILSALSDADKAVSCGIMDPTSNRYWCFVKGANGESNAIYVYSNFRESGVSAWGTYSPTAPVALTPSSNVYVGPGFLITYSGLDIGGTYTWTPGVKEIAFVSGTTTILTSTLGVGVAVTFIATATTVTVTGFEAVGYTGLLTQQVAFVPERFELLNGRIYIRAVDNIYLYGGVNNATYDDSVAEWSTFWMDAKSPSTVKNESGIDAAFTGGWLIKAGVDPKSGTLEEVYNYTEPTYWQGRIPFTRNGTHAKMYGKTTGKTAATFDAFSILFQGGNTT